METLSNSVLTVQIAEHGAELQSIKRMGKNIFGRETLNFGDGAHLSFSP